MSIDTSLIMAKSDELVLFDIDDVLFHTQRFIDSGLVDFQLYEDVLVTLDALAEKYEFGILSQGESTLQIKKLIETGIDNKFAKDHIHIVEKKDASLSQTLKPYTKMEKIWFIDDRIAGLFYAKQALPQLKTIWLRRGRHVLTDQTIDGFTPDFEVEKLSEVTTIL